MKNKNMKYVDRQIFWLQLIIQQLSLKKQPDLYRLDSLRALKSISWTQGCFIPVPPFPYDNSHMIK